MKQDSLLNKTFEVTSANMTTQLKAVFNDSTYPNAGINFSEKYAAIIQRSLKLSTESARKLINEDMVEIYDKYFTMADIENFIVFYQTKSGQKMIDMLPNITKDLMSVMTIKYSPAIQQAMMKEIEELMKVLQKQ